MENQNNRNNQENDKIFDAIENGIDSVKEAIETGSDVNAENNEYFHSPLSFSLEKEKYDIAELLIEKGADVNKEFEDGSSVLYYLLNNKNYNDDIEKVLDEMIKKGLDLNKIHTFLDIEILTNNTYPYNKRQMVNEFIYNAGNLLNKQNLHNARSFYEKIINAGYDIKNILKTSDGSEFLTKISINNSNDFIQFLIEKGINVNKLFDLIKNEYEYDNDATKKRCEEIIKLLIEIGVDMPTLKNKLWSIIINKDKFDNFTQYLIDKIPVEILNNHNYIMDVLYKQQKNIELLKAMYEKGADINMPDRSQHGATPLILALYQQNYPAVDFLVKHGANKMSTYMGKSILEIAKGIADEKLLNILLRRRKGVCEYMELNTNKEGDWVYDIHEHEEEWCVSSAGLEKYMKTKITIAEGSGVKKTIKCFGCDKKITANDVIFIVSDEFFNAFYQEWVPDVSVNRAAFPIILSNTIKNKNYRPNNGTPNNEFSPNYHHSLCPYCLVSDERTHGCAYITHKHPTGMLVDEVFNKYNAIREQLMPSGKLEWCVECGRPSLAHQHFTLDDVPTLIQFKIGENGIPIFDKCMGGGRAEMFARLLAINRELEKYSEEEKTMKKMNNFNDYRAEEQRMKEIRRACAVAADRVPLDAELMEKGREIAAKEASERSLSGGRAQRRKMTRKKVARGR